MIFITDINDPQIAEFRSLRDYNHQIDGTIIAESEKVVVKLIKAGGEIIKILALDTFYQRYQNRLPSNCQLFCASKEMMEQLVGFRLHHGVLALGKRPANIPLNQLGDMILVLNGLTSPENVGSIMRSAAAFNINSLIVDQESCCPYVRRCIRVSMGNIFNLKIHQTDNLVNCLQQLKNYRIVGTANLPNAIDLKDYIFPTKGALIIGSEGHGIAPEIFERCQDLVRISIDDQVAALNAATSAAIFMYKISLG